jgi:hypothetical protein
MTILWTILMLLLAFAIYILIRNQKVYRYRRRMADVVFSASVWDYKWRLQVYESVTYNDMMLRFWKPLDSFYPDKSFLDLNDVRGQAPWEKTA